MSKNTKYKVKKHEGEYGITFLVERGSIAISSSWKISEARKIARALNAMEDKPKAPKFAFDWSCAKSAIKWAAMDSSGFWHGYETKPKVTHYDDWGTGRDNWNFLSDRLPKYPGDWRDSLQERPKGK